jgi:4-oxalocrotonate tautomerase
MQCMNNIRLQHFAVHPYAHSSPGCRGRRTGDRGGQCEATEMKGIDFVPLVRIDLNKDAPAERVRAVSQAVYGAMADIANVPVNDKFQIVTRHTADEIIYPAEGYLGIKYSPDLIIIQVTWVGGRSTDVKKQFYRRIADVVHEKAGVRREDIWISLVDSGREDWSFGNGDMQYAQE